MTTSGHQSGGGPRTPRDFQLETYFSRWEFEASHHLTASDAESRTLEQLLALGSQAERERFQALHLAYIPTWGTDELRAAIADTYARVDSSDVLTFAGAGEALYWAMQLFTGPGDQVIATVPNYQSIESVPLASGVHVVGLPLWDGDGGERQWTFDIDRLESLLNERTRIVALNFPNNPTGFVPPREDWLRCLELCHERGVRVVSDEVYRGVELDASRTLPQAADVTPSAISINVLSKAYGLPGLRIGWVACRDRVVLGRLERAKHYTSICNAAPAEALGALALRHREALLGDTRSVLRTNAAPVAEFMERHGDLFDYEPPLGGCVAYPRYKGPDGVETFCRRAVEEHGVLLLPASIYASELLEAPGDCFRIGLGRRNVPECLERLDEHLRER
ncbi:MAG: pyridoxal phosphate-dependent aminotransferase [Acidobacteriota bacterium]